MNVLVTNLKMDGFNGTTMYVKELTHSLLKRGHHVQIYTRVIGEIGKELLLAGIIITDNLKNISFEPDIIHAHNNITAYDALSFYKNTPMVFWIHDKLSPYDFAPLHKNIVNYLCVDYNCKERYRDDFNFDKSDSKVIYNWANIERFHLKEKFQEVPKKALVFSNYATDNNYLVSIKNACADLNITVDVIGKESGNQISNPENYLANYDIVFAKAKAAMEALATGAAVIVSDYKGLAGIVTLKNISHYRKYNFGMKLMKHPNTAVSIKKEILKYNSEEIKAVSNKIRTEIDIEITIDKIINVYKESIASFEKGNFGTYKSTFSNYLSIKRTTLLFIVSEYLKKNCYSLFFLFRKFYRKNHL